MKTLKYIFLLAVFITSCTSTSTRKDITFDNHRADVDNSLSRIEAAVVPLEVSGGSEGRNRRQNDVTSARQLINSMERHAAADAYFSGKLIAWSGRLAIIEGKYSEAQRLHRQSNTVSPGNMTAIILGIRLEGDPLKRLEMIERELVILGPRSASTLAGIGELNIERGRALLEAERYLEAAGAFDVAFAAGLNEVYNKNYAANRNQAWELRNSTGVAAGTRDLLGRDAISWNDCIALARNETQLLRFLTAGRNLSDAELFNRLVERGFIPSTQDITIREWSDARPRANDNVTRAGAAWFIWHLHAEARGDRTLLTRYSTRFATGANPRSPIADVPALSPFFDSILGCVETEFLSLPDGRNFRPGHVIRASELLAILRRIDS